jgi:RNA polymerase sigma-70 factor (ECF subfamily)
VLVNGELGLAFPDLPAEDGYRQIDRRITTFTVRDGQIWRIYDMCNPDKLTRVPGL